ncbi:MAG: ATP-binding protein [Thermofilaceae archaeon]
MSSPPPLQLVRLDRPVPYVPLFARLKRGARVAGATVIYTVPPEGVVTPATLVEPVERAEMEVEELREGVTVVTLRVGGRSEVYVYPSKVWRVVNDRYIEPLLNGEPPLNPGVLFTGPPGTGKSSMIHILASGLGLPTLSLDSSLLRPYLGVTERNLRRLLMEAENSEPCIILADEVEWVLQARQHAQISGAAATLSTFISELLVTMQRWKNRGRRILIAAATNVSPSDLDQAFLREGRFGKPVNVPLPDYPAVRELLRRLGVPEQAASLYARKAVNAGLSMADIVSIAEEVKRGREPEIRGRRLRGYYRLAPNPTTALDREGRERLMKLLPPALFEAPGARVHVSGTLDVALPIVAEYLMELGKPMLMIFDPRHLDEAVSTAELSNAVVVAPTDPLDPGVLSHLHLSLASTPVAAVGERSPPFACYTVTAQQVLQALGRLRWLKLLCDYYEVRAGEAELRRADQLEDRSLQRLALLLRNYSGRSLDEALRLIV